MSIYPLGRTGVAPVYSQIRDILAKEISECFEAGDALPAESDLAERFGVNRHTLRRAVDHLVADGVVERHHGKGVFVSERVVKYTISGATRFTDMLQSEGMQSHTIILRKEYIPAHGGVANQLGLDEGAEVAFIETLREVEGRPFCVISHFFSAAMLPDLLDNYRGGSLHGLLNSHYGLSVIRRESFITAVTPKDNDVAVLKIPRQMPILRVKSVNLNADTLQPIEYSISRFRGDAVQLFIQP